MHEQFNLLDQWGQYLVSNALAPADQFSTDIFAGSLANQTNLAVKGIIALKAMSEIAALAGQSDKAASYEVGKMCAITELRANGCLVYGKHIYLSMGKARSVRG